MKIVAIKDFKMPRWGCGDCKLAQYDFVEREICGCPLLKHPDDPCPLVEIEIGEQEQSK